MNKLSSKIIKIHLTFFLVTKFCQSQKIAWSTKNGKPQLFLAQFWPDTNFAAKCTPKEEEQKEALSPPIEKVSVVAVESSLFASVMPSPLSCLTKSFWQVNQHTFHLASQAEAMPKLYFKHWSHGSRQNQSWIYKWFAHQGCKQQSSVSLLSKFCNSSLYQSLDQ